MNGNCPRQSYRVLLKCSFYFFRDFFCLFIQYIFTVCPYFFWSTKEDKSPLPLNLNFIFRHTDYTTNFSVVKFLSNDESFFTNIIWDPSFNVNISSAG